MSRQPDHPDPRDRTITWDGLVNGRDLHGLVMADGAGIEAGRLVRSASPHTLTAAGWASLVDAGVTSTIDLRHDWEIADSPIPEGRPPTGVEWCHLPVEPPGYIESWTGRADQWKLGTPLYYQEFMAEHRSRVVTVLEAIADAPAGPG